VDNHCQSKVFFIWASWIARPTLTLTLSLQSSSSWCIVFGTMVPTSDYSESLWRARVMTVTSGEKTRIRHPKHLTQTWTSLHRGVSSTMRSARLLITSALCLQVSRTKILMRHGLHRWNLDGVISKLQRTTVNRAMSMTPHLVTYFCFNLCLDTTIGIRDEDYVGDSALEPRPPLYQLLLSRSHYLVQVSCSYKLLVYLHCVRSCLLRAFHMQEIQYRITYSRLRRKDH